MLDLNTIFRYFQKEECLIYKSRQSDLCFCCPFTQISLSVCEMIVNLTEIHKNPNQVYEMHVSFILKTVKSSWKTNLYVKNFKTKSKFLPQKLIQKILLPCK